MITQYFDINARLIIQAPGNLAPAGAETWVYGDNYNLAIYLVANGVFQTIGPNDTLDVMLFQPGGTLPEQELAIVSTPTVNTDPAGYNYYLINVNLETVPLASLVQTPNKPALCNFHYIFNPADGERFSSSADLPVTVNPDPSQNASGATPIPPGYPTNPNVFEQIAHKGVVSGYASLDATGKVPAAQLPASTAGGDMLKSVYDTDNDGVVDTCDSIQSSRVIGLGTAAVQNIPASGNASSGQVVMGNDSRLADSRTPLPHQATHNGGSDPIPVASPSAQGLCPTIDGTTIQIVSGKLTATTTGNGDMLKSVYDTNNDGVVDNAAALQTHIVPPSGNASVTQVVLGSDTRLSDSRTPLAHAATHVGGSDPIALASAAASGLCPPVDNVTIQVSASKLAAILATTSAPGIVQPDGSTITISAGKISAAPSALNVNARVNQSAAQALSATAGTLTAINWGAADFQNGGTFWVSGSPSRLTVPAGQGGLYAVGGNLTFAVNSSGSLRQIAIKFNGGAFIVYSNTVVGGSAGAWVPSVCASIIQVFAAGQYAELFAAADVASLNTAPGNGPINFWMFRIA